MLYLPNIAFMGIGTNLACRSGVSPDCHNMGELTTLANSIEVKFGLIVKIISGGNSANLDWSFGEVDSSIDQDIIKQAILAIDRQDTDVDGLTPPVGITILAASSDHLVVDLSNYDGKIEIGSEISFQLNYSSLLRSMTSPFIIKVMK